MEKEKRSFSPEHEALQEMLKAFNPSPKQWVAIGFVALGAIIALIRRW